MGENRSFDSFEGLERLLQKVSKSHKSHVNNRNKKIMLEDKIAKIAKQDNVVNCIDPTLKAEAIKVDVKKIRCDLIVIRRRMKSDENWLLTHQINRLLHTLTHLKDIKPVLGITMVPQD